MRAVDVHLDAGLLVELAVGVAAEVVAALEHEDLQAQLGGAALGDGEAEEAGADDDEVGTGLVEEGLTRSVSLRIWWARHAFPARRAWPGSHCAPRPVRRAAG